MLNQNIISNKFDLNWSTMFSYTGVQRFLQNPTPCTTFLRNRGIYIEDWNRCKRKWPSAHSSQTKRRNDAHRRSRKWH